MKKVMLLTLALALALVMALVAVPAQAATPAEIEQSIVDGLEWLCGEGDELGQQQADGSWGYDTAKTGLVLIKLQERAYELGYSSPFDPAYEYSDEIVAGWTYIFTGGRTAKQTPLGTQDHTAGASGTVDNPDTNANGYGVYFTPRTTYATGICLMALVASGTPNRQNDGALDFDGINGADTFKELAQEAADWLAYGQTDSGAGEGGWDYDATNNGAGSPDNSNSGYAVLGLAGAEDFGCVVPQWVKAELNAWIGTIQDPVNGDNDDGGSWYEPGWAWVNQLKTGNLIFQMAFYGDAAGDQRVQDALGYIERNWRVQECCEKSPPYDADGWGYNQDPACYQAMYCLMKGLVYMGIELIDTDGDGVRDNSWFNQEPSATPPEDFATTIVAQQRVAGSWDATCWGDTITNTVWALLTLERFAPTTEVGGTVESVNLSELDAISSGLSDGGSNHVWLPLSAGLALIVVIGGGVFLLRRQRAN
jgi:hypothetical protein